MNSIITLTDRAVVQIKKLLSDAPIETEGLLIDVDKSGCSGYSYKLDFANKESIKGFEYVEKNSVKIFIDPKATMFLVGSEMDYSEDKLSSRFIFRNPNEKNTCGCGESFSL